MTDRILVLVRHGESDWNLKNLFTGWHDCDLSEKGVAEAHAAGCKLKAQGFKFDICFTSALKRAQRTLALILEELGQKVEENSSSDPSVIAIGRARRTTSVSALVPTPRIKSGGMLRREML